MLHALWTEPFFDEDGGDIFMVTYSVPIIRKERKGDVVTERFAGVATADLALAYFVQLRTWLADMKLGKDSYCFVLGPHGTFISHPNTEWKCPKKITDIPAYKEGKAMTTLTERLLHQQTGSVPVMIDPHINKRSTYYFRRCRRHNGNSWSLSKSSKCHGSPIMGSARQKITIFPRKNVLSRSERRLC